MSRPHTSLLARGHSFDLVTQRTPIICLELRILNPFLTPVLMQAADMVLASLKNQQLVADAFFDQHASGVLLHNRSFVL